MECELPMEMNVEWHTLISMNEWGHTMSGNTSLSGLHDDHARAMVIFNLLFRMAAGEWERALSNCELPTDKHSCG